MDFVKFFLNLFIFLQFIFFFNKCEDDGTNGEKYKSNKEIYISGISASPSVIHKSLSTYYNLAKEFYNYEDKNIFIEKNKKEIKKISNTKNYFNFYSLFNIIFPYKEDDDFVSVEMLSPTNLFNYFRTENDKKRVLIANKLIILNLIMGYLLQCKKNYESWNNNQEINNDIFYNSIKNLFSKNCFLYEIISNRFKTKENDSNTINNHKMNNINNANNINIENIIESNNKNDENMENDNDKTSAFDLLIKVAEFIDGIEKIKKKFKEVININNININNINNVENFSGILWLFPKKSSKI